MLLTESEGPGNRLIATWLRRMHQEERWIRLGAGTARSIHLVLIAKKMETSTGAVNELELDGIGQSCRIQAMHLEYLAQGGVSQAICLVAKACGDAE